MRVLLTLFLLPLLSVVALAADIPAQVHIALAGKDVDGNSNTVSVSWNTRTEQPQSQVLYGTQSGVYPYTAVDQQSSYYETYNHYAVLGALQPDTKYYYIVGNEASGYTEELSFTSAPLTSQLRGNFSFLVFGDLGVVNGDPTTEYIKKVRDGVELVWHAGDVSYADDSFLHKDCVFDFCYEDTFDKYMNDAQYWASDLPYMTTPGNHEADCHSPACIADADKREKLSNFTAYNNRFHMPSAESGGVLNMWYSFNYGNVHFISLDTETGYPGAAEETRYVFPCGGFGDMLSWLEADLIEANQHRAERPWIFAAGHHPMYQGDSINADFQAAMEDLFYQYGVDVYFAGHVHSYERDYPVYQGVPETSYENPLATTHLLIGGAGNDEMHGIQYDRSKDPAPKPKKWQESDKDGSWTAVTDKDDHVGIGKVTIVDDSTLKFEYIRTMTEEVFDSVTFTRDHSRYGKQRTP